ncbi:MAG: hypothetical protein RIA63_11360, partial [Cyclobacteriaceae bacterium]
MIFFCGITPSISAQDSSEAKFGIPLKISGSISGSAIGYSVTGIPARRDPLYWLISGNFNIQFWQ